MASAPSTPKAGWEVKTLGEVCEVARGTTITKKTAKEGTVPVVAGGLQPAYYHNEANRGPNMITVSGSGANAGFVNFYEEEIFASDCSTVSPKSDCSLDTRFTYYFMKGAEPFITSELRRGAAQPHVYPNLTYSSRGNCRAVDVGMRSRLLG